MSRDHADVVLGGGTDIKWRQSLPKTSVVPEVLLHFQMPSSFLLFPKFGCLRKSTDTILRPSLSSISS